MCSPYWLHLPEFIVQGLGLASMPSAPCLLLCLLDVPNYDDGTLMLLCYGVPGARGGGDPGGVQRRRPGMLQQHHGEPRRQGRLDPDGGRPLRGVLPRPRHRLRPVPHLLERAAAAALMMPFSALLWTRWQPGGNSHH